MALKFNIKQYAHDAAADADYITQRINAHNLAEDAHPELRLPLERIDAAQPVVTEAEKDVPDGYASLDAGGKLKKNQIPPVTMEMIADRSITGDKLTSSLYNELVTHRNEGAYAKEQGDIAKEVYEAMTQSEGVREAAEAQRQEAEVGRAAAERSRASTEGGRQEAEAEREAAEQERQNAETARQEAENARSAKEASRAGAEISRAAAERTRVTAETSRNKTFDRYIAAIDGGPVASINGHTGIVTLPKGKPCKIVIGHTSGGWTEDDCDILCTGTGDYTAINNAIASLPDGGGEILLLDGIYNLGSRLYIRKPSVTLRGNGRATVLRKQFYLNHTINIEQAAEKACIRDLTIDGDGNAFNDGCAIKNAAKYTTIDNVFFEYCYLGAINSEGDCLRVTGCTINKTSSDGIRSAGSDCLIAHNYLYNPYSTGIVVQTGTQNRVIGNTIIFGMNGVYSGSGYSVIANNIIHNASSCGIRIPASYNNVTGNLVYRGEGASSSYISSQNTIEATGSYNLIASNSIPGKNYTDSGQNNTFINNKFNQS